MENGRWKAALKTAEVRVILLKRGISQNNLARRAEVSQGYLSQLLKRTRHAGPAVRKRLMRALKVEEFDEIFEAVSDSAASVEGAL